jgi:hypothetical protein
MKTFYGMKRGHGIMVVALLIAGLAMGASSTWADKAAGPTKAGNAMLPASLFVAVAPANALDVGDARKSAVEGKPIVMRGQIGGLAKPFAEKYAMFVVCDKRLAVCPSGCTNPADFCSVPRDRLMASIATVQVLDRNGALLKSSVEGLNGLRTLSEVVIRGTVAKKDQNILVVNAENIYVNNAISGRP